MKNVYLFENMHFSFQNQPFLGNFLNSDLSRVKGGVWLASLARVRPTIQKHPKTVITGVEGLFSARQPPIIINIRFDFGTS